MRHAQPEQFTATTEESPRDDLALLLDTFAKHDPQFEKSGWTASPQRYSRKRVLEDGRVEAVIISPADLFPDADTPGIQLHTTRHGVRFIAGWRYDADTGLLTNGTLLHVGETCGISLTEPGTVSYAADSNPLRFPPDIAIADFITMMTAQDDEDHPVPMFAVTETPVMQDAAALDTTPETEPGTEDINPLLPSEDDLRNAGWETDEEGWLARNLLNGALTERLNFQGRKLSFTFEITLHGGEHRTYVFSWDRNDHGESFIGGQYLTDYSRSPRRIKEGRVFLTVSLGEDTYPLRIVVPAALTLDEIKAIAGNNSIMFSEHNPHPTTPKEDYIIEDGDRSR